MESMRPFRKPEFRNDKRIQEQAQQLGILVNPSFQDVEWVANMGISESPLFKDDGSHLDERKADAHPKEETVQSTGSPAFTVEQGFKLQQELIEAYSQPDFQQELHSRFKAVGDDQKKQAGVRQELTFPIQSTILPKYGFTPDTAGVMESMKTFRGPELRNDERIQEQGQQLAFLVNPPLQDVDFAFEMGITESPLIDEVIAG
mmetsp:Transcript_131914/g.228580  ORF Transcript_131914/g.228580 Transcript_131914/m.228580 type:complete len:203 (+) Transcript_131914:3-611(+)